MLHFVPIHSPTLTDAFDLAAGILACIEAANDSLKPGDILIVSSKYAAVAEGRVVRLSEVSPTDEARQLAETYRVDPVMAEIVRQESDAVLGGIPGFLLSVKDNLIAPNAGIDQSNIPEGFAVLYPAKPFAVSETLRDELQKATGVDVGIALSDSRLMPGRTGTTGVAVGVAGFRPVVDERGRSDLHGRLLKVSQRAVADNLCAAAELLMGEADEGIPIVIARGTDIPLTQERYTWQDLAIDYREDIYIASLSDRKF
jgi:coenzyme F420-0:L-glutamate ligase / coenzyme F420-1:gamma-L-glutamate ligase